MKRKRIENRNSILQLFLSVIFGAVMLAGCTDDAFQSNRGRPVDQTGVPEGFVRARINMIASGFEIVQTKSLTNQQEHEWSHVVVGQFDENGLLVPESVKQYVPNEGGEFNVILRESGGQNNLIYFITNYGEKGGESTDMNDSKNNPFLKSAGGLITTLDEFKEQVYTPDSVLNADIAANDKLVMVGTINMEVNRNQTPITSILVYVDKLTAKLDVRIRASQSISNSTHPFNAAELKITGLQIMNVPKHAAFATDGKQIGSPDSLSFVKAKLTDATGSLVKSYSTVESYYILENRRHADDQPIYPNNTAERGKEQFKNNAARDHGIADKATYLLIEGEMNDGRSVGKVTWTIYLGENNVDNFNIKRNTHYTVTVQIDGAGIATADIRVNKDNLHVRELRYLNSRYGSNRSPETSYLGPGDTNWGNQKTPAEVASGNYLYMDAGNGTWGFRLTGSNGGALPDWPGLSVSYLPLAQEGAKDPGTVIGMDTAQIRSKWLPDYVESNWKSVTMNDDGITANGIPSGVRVRINVGANRKLADRTMELHYFNDAEPEMTRAWRVTQYATDMIMIPDQNFFPSPAGTYGVMVRAKKGIYWRFQSGDDTNFKFAGTANNEGNIVQSTRGEGYLDGHGTIVFNTAAHATTPYRTKSIVVRVFDKDPAEDDSQYVDKTVTINQMSPVDKLLATKDNQTKRYVYDYSTDPLFETMFAFEKALPMGINLVDDDKQYHKDESRYEAWSTTDGKANTLAIYNKLEGYIAAEISNTNLQLTAPPVFSPVGLAMMMNKNWWTITGTNESNFEWYIPARYHGLMAATYVMLGIEGIAYSSQAAFWTSTVPREPIALEQSSGYFAGTTVDVSSNFSSTSRVRCVRDKSVSRSYPYVTQDNGGNPVIVSHENVGGVEKGFVRIQTSTNATWSIYKLEKPLRFTEAGQIPAIDGKGPSSPNYSYLSPRFRVAKQDAVVNNRTGSLSGSWVLASGWSDANANDIPLIATGCAAYEEDGTGWRVPSELEMRLILLLGGGIGSADGSAAQVPTVQTGGMSLKDIPGFRLLGTTSGRSYWVNRKYPNDNRAVYFSASETWARAISGSAVAWDSNYYVRCVRDL